MTLFRYRFYQPDPKNNNFLQLKCETTNKSVSMVNALVTRIIGSNLDSHMRRKLAYL